MKPRLKPKTLFINKKGEQNQKINKLKTENFKNKRSIISKLCQNISNSRLLFHYKNIINFMGFLSKDTQILVNMQLKRSRFSKKPSTKEEQGFCYKIIL